jgi:hypothetical protein
VVEDIGDSDIGDGGISTHVHGIRRNRLLLEVERGRGFLGGIAHSREAVAYALKCSRGAIHAIGVDLDPAIDPHRLDARGQDHDRALRFGRVGQPRSAALASIELAAELVELAQRSSAVSAAGESSIQRSPIGAPHLV